MASDSLHEAQTTVVIFVKDVNDLPPVFDQGTYTGTLTEHSLEFRNKPVLKVMRF